MLLIIVAEQNTDRAKEVETFLKKNDASPIDALIFEEDSATLAELAQHANAPLFGVAPKALRGRYLLESAAKEKNIVSLLETLHQVLIPVVLEEREITSATKKIIQSSGAAVKIIEKKKVREGADVFSIANALTVGDKKNIWMQYRTLLETNTAEAIFGILLWKVRQLSETAKNKKTILALYGALLHAQSESRTGKLPFELSLERTLLTAQYK